MENANGSINASELATLSLIGGGYGGYGGIGVGAGNHSGGSYGGLYAGNQVLAANAHADGTATGAKLDSVASSIRDRSSDFENAERTRQFSTLQMQNANVETRLATQIANIELNALRDKADTLVAINSNAKDAAACCCDSKLESAKNTAALTAEILAVESRGIQRDLDRCERNAAGADTAAAIVNAMQNQTNTLVTLLGDNGHGRGK